MLTPACSSLGLDGPGHNMLRGENQIAGGTPGGAQLFGGEDPRTGRVPLSGSPGSTIGAMHTLDEMSQADVDRHPAAIGRCPVSLLPTPADLARSILSLGPGIRWDSHGVVPLCASTIRTGEVFAARFRLAFPVPVGGRVGWNLVELQAGGPRRVRSQVTTMATNIRTRAHQ